MINFWWVTRPKRKLNSIPEVLATFAEISLNQEWQGHVDKNDFGNDVVQILADPSAMVTGFPSDEGLMMYMCFSNDGTMHTYYYSPLYDAYYNSTFENTYEMRVV